MIRGLYTAASGMLAEARRNDVIANNLANVDTTGFKKDTAVVRSFGEMLLRRFHDPVELPDGQREDPRPIIGSLGVGAGIDAAATDFVAGPQAFTQNPLDLALEGDGFFTVLTPRGERYTRNGAFNLNGEGVLVTSEGYPVLGENGLITLREGEVSISSDGQISLGATVVDRLRTVQFADLRGLRKEGDSLWAATPIAGPPAPSAEVAVKQGYREKSNVNVIREMVDMITAVRAYEANQKMVQAHDELLGRAVNQVGNV
ncbi:MAG: flagellar basal-body rod protein FlgF [Firmicutes bacterium]|nr:flagellar basal-body rod protein FlgF [Bacillota bacterium]